MMVNVALITLLFGCSPALAALLAPPKALRTREEWLRIKSADDVLTALDCSDITLARTVELKPGGGEIEVCAENLDEYLELRLRHIMVERISDQLAQFLLGVYEVVPLALLCVFTTYELELLICGLPFIDTTDWRSHTVYRGAFVLFRFHPSLLFCNCCLRTL